MFTVWYSNRDGSQKHFDRKSLWAGCNGDQKMTAQNWLTASGETDPAMRLKKLNERRQHIEDTIAELKDKHYVIESEIAELVRGR
jgi:hypothetical protein